MKIYFPFAVAIRIIIYSVIMLGVAEVVRLDALYPMQDGYYGELSFTEILQEIILFVLFILYLVAGRRFPDVRPVTDVISLFFLASFIREFNFLIDWWALLVFPVVLLAVWQLVRNSKYLKEATVRFFSQPASAWFMAGLLITFVFSRLMGRSSFWRLLYDENTYRLAKAAVEEGLELAGDVLMLISAVEFFLARVYNDKKKPDA